MKSIASPHFRQPLRAGFTLVELLVVISIIAVLAALAFPVVARIRASADTASCLSNLRQVHFVYMRDVQEDNGLLPLSISETGTGWIDSLHDRFIKTGDADLLKTVACPAQLRAKPLLSRKRTFSLNKDINRNPHNLNDYGLTRKGISVFTKPSETALVADGNDTDKAPKYYNALIHSTRMPDAPHNGYTNVLFLDGHTESRAKEKIPKNALGSPVGSANFVFWFGE